MRTNLRSAHLLLSPRMLARAPDPKATLARLSEERRSSYAEAHIHIRSGIQGHGEVVDKIIDAVRQHLDE